MNGRLIMLVGWVIEEEDKMRLEVIFQVHTARGWLDYCRETAPGNDVTRASRWGIEQCNMLEKREGQVFRFYIEAWN